MDSVSSPSTHGAHVFSTQFCRWFSEVPVEPTSIRIVPIRRRQSKNLRRSRDSVKGLSWDGAIPYLVPVDSRELYIFLSKHAFTDARMSGVFMLQNASPEDARARLLSFFTPSSVLSGPLVTPPPSAIETVTPAWSKPRIWSQHATASVCSKNKSALVIHSPAISISTTGTEASTSPQTHIKGPSYTSTSHLGYATQPPASIEELYSNAHECMHAPLTVPVGLVNQGNSCFASAVLQMLVFCRPLYMFLTQLRMMVPQDLSNSTPLLEAIFRFYSEIPVVSKQLYGLVEESVDPILPDYIYDAMRLHKRFDLFQLGHQEDAEEFLSLILSTLHEEVVLVFARAMQRKKSSASLQQRAPKKSVAMGDPYAAYPPPMESDNSSDEEDILAMEVQRPPSPEQDEWLEVGQKGRTSLTRTSGNTDTHSPVTRMFDGKLRSTLSCPGAKTSVMVEPYRSLPLDIQSSHVHTIEDALRHITEPELISGVWSPQRNAYVDATKQVCIEALPPVLVLHLKRFVFDEFYGVQKSTKPIHFGMSLEISPDILSTPCRRACSLTKYALFGVVYHHGRLASGGHYTVAVRRQDDSGWIHIDDTYASQISAEEVMFTGHRSSTHNGQAYLLFYQKVPPIM